MTRPQILILLYGFAVIAGVLWHEAALSAKVSEGVTSECRKERISDKVYSLICNDSLAAVGIEAPKAKEPSVCVGGACKYNLECYDKAGHPVKFRAYYKKHTGVDPQQWHITNEPYDSSLIRLFNTAADYQDCLAAGGGK